MNVRELIERLATLPPDSPVVVWGSNGGYEPERDIATSVEIVSLVIHDSGISSPLFNRVTPPTDCVIIE